MERQKIIIIGSVIIGLIIVVLIIFLTIRNKDGFFLFIEDETHDLRTTISDLDVLNMVYPVGSVYLTTNANFNNPSAQFGGGTWAERLGPINNIYIYKRTS